MAYHQLPGNQGERSLPRHAAENDVIHRVFRSAGIPSTLDDRATGAVVLPEESVPPNS